MSSGSSVKNRMRPCRRTLSCRFSILRSSSELITIDTFQTQRPLYCNAEKELFPPSLVVSVCPIVFLSRRDRNCQTILFGRKRTSGIGRHRAWWTISPVEVDHHPCPSVALPDH